MCCPVSHGLLTSMNPHQHHLYHTHSCQLHGLQSCSRLPLTSLTTQKLFSSSLLPQIITQSSRLVDAMVPTPVSIFPCLSVFHLVTKVGPIRAYQLRSPLSSGTDHPNYWGRCADPPGVCPWKWWNWSLHS
jgi:hypothetical protein